MKIYKYFGFEKREYSSNTGLVAEYFLEATCVICRHVAIFFHFRPPFRGVDHMKTYNLILKGIDAVTFPKHVNKTVQLLVKKLCRPVPTQRLGYLKEGVEGIKKDR